MNLDFSLGCDYTNYVLDNISLFANCVHLQWSYDVLQNMLMNADSRINQTERAMLANKADVQNELNAPAEFPYTLNNRLGSAYQICTKNIESCKACNPLKSKYLFSSGYYA
jgi:hypothetical protein